MPVGTAASATSTDSWDFRPAYGQQMLQRQLDRLTGTSLTVSASGFPVNVLRTQGPQGGNGGGGFLTNSWLL